MRFFNTGLRRLISTPAPVAPTGTRWGANYFPNVTLTTQDRKTVHFYDDLLRDKAVAIELVYTNCRYSCPLETARLAQVQKLLGDQMGKGVFFYSISIDPKRDTPEVLKAYAEKFHAGPGWLFLKAIICCRLSSLNTLLMAPEANLPRSDVNVPGDYFSLAGFEVNMYGRFWVTPEDTLHRNCRWLPGKHVRAQLLALTTMNLIAQTPPQCWEKLYA
jgi:hypothetical protein